MKLPVGLLSWASSGVGLACVVLAWHLLVDPWADVAVLLAMAGGIIMAVGYLHRNTTAVGMLVEHAQLLSGRDRAEKLTQMVRPPENDSAGPLARHASRHP